MPISLEIEQGALQETKAAQGWLSGEGESQGKEEKEGGSFHPLEVSKRIQNPCLS